jgi:hypothetical protein
MFRDLKEYQEIAKIYAEKVSKPENLEERSRSNPSGLTPEQKKANQKGFVNRILFGNPEGKRAKPSNKRAEASKRRNQPPKKKMSNIPVIDGPVNNPEYGKNMSRDAKDLNPPEKKTEPPKATETKPKKKMHPIEKKNRARLGDAKVDALKAKNKDFQAMKKGGMSKDDFIKKYPKSITAQKAKGLRDHTEWDAYDMVLEYLYSTEQVESLEEANYVMMEMDQKTIGEIVNEVKEALINENV